MEALCFVFTVMTTTKKRVECTNEHVAYVRMHVSLSHFGQDIFSCWGLTAPEPILDNREYCE